LDLLYVYPIMPIKLGFMVAEMSHPGMAEGALDTSRKQAVP
jgi:hypothetical protein